ncbi:DUF2199 domain-containing protein [Prosthecobacter sp.]|uniref:DUF2199 domain-containing protein n=1 Tax=Prosthecobacter sp. TaxID=1965333 RepID=UPI003782D98D
MKFKCPHCNEIHDGLPSWGFDRPSQYYDVPADKIESDVFLTSDSCVIADRFFFIRGCLDIPIIGSDETYTWGVWTSLSETNFFIWQDHYEVAQRSHIGPFFGWFNSSLSVYPETMHLKCMVHLQDNGQRPKIILEETDHPLSVHQRNGIRMETLLGMMHALEKQAQTA